MLYTSIIALQCFQTLYTIRESVHCTALVTFFLCLRFTFKPWSCVLAFPPVPSLLLFIALKHHDVKAGTVPLTSRFLHFLFACHFVYRGLTVALHLPRFAFTLPKDFVRRICDNAFKALPFMPLPFGSQLLGGKVLPFRQA